MNIMKSTELSAFTRLFSTSVIRELSRKGHSPLFARLVRETSLPEILEASDNVAKVFDYVFDVLRKKNFRDEYVYKAALTEKILLGKHSLRTASMLTEFRVGDCRADVAILNGTATVYEVKSERDSLSRLQNQMDAYRKVFACVNVIAGEKHINSILSSVSEEVGVLVLSDRYRISIVREPVEQAHETEPAMILRSVRTSEAKAILGELDDLVPDVPNTQMFQALAVKFDQHEPEAVHRAMVKVLKKSRNLSPLGALMAQLPSSLRPAALSTPLRKADHQRLADSLETPFGEARAWG